MVSNIVERTVGAALRGRPRFKMGSPKSEAVGFRRRDQTTGGHGGPPLQYVPSDLKQQAAIIYVELSVTLTAQPVDR